MLDDPSTAHSLVERNKEFAQISNYFYYGTLDNS